ncbi:MAG: glycosyltransferase family 39 protein, partial [Rhodospirillales bacterium]
MLLPVSSFPVWAVCWLICLIAAIWLRPPLPVDETRYLAVAWEMWLRGDFLVPYLNGEPYHHKPPLLFWLMHAGWSVFGVNEWWPRLVAPLFALATLWGTGRLSRLLWPDDATAAGLAPVILVGALFWSIFQTLTMFDMMLTTCTVAGLCGVVQAWRQGGWVGWLITALAIGVGVLAKGPAILLHIVPVALLAPWWGRVLPGGPDRPMVSWRRWYLSLLLSVLAGAAMALMWAIPAGIRGGAEYREMIFWGQSAGRIVDSFDHARPFWWYAALLPPLLLPWLVWPRLWRAFGARPTQPDGAIRLLVSWIVPALFIFSLISGKQLHYLLPESPAFALL